MIKTRYLLLVLIAVISMQFFVACGKDSPSFSLLPGGQTFKQNKDAFNNQLDILWVVDNSGSMGPFQTNLANNFNSFINDFQKKGYDYRISVTTSDAYRAAAGFANNPTIAKFKDGLTTHTGVFVILPTTSDVIGTFVTNAIVGSTGNPDERVFSSMRESLNSTLNAGFLRPQSFLAVVILSDEDDFSGASRCAGCTPDHSYTATTLDTVQSYVTYLDQLTQSTAPSRRYNVSSITVLDDACRAQHAVQSASTIIGQRYIQLSNMTNGVTSSICDASFANSLQSIQARIAELSTKFFLDRAPQDGTIVIRVNGIVIPNDSSNGWTYSALDNSITFHGTAVPDQNATIDVSFVPVTITN